MPPEPWHLRPATAIAAVATLALAHAAHPSEPIPCGARINAEAAMRRLNETRQRGATCPAGAMPTAPPLAWNDRLADAAQMQAREMARLDRMSHLDSRNRGLGERLRSVGYRYGVALENLAVGHASLDDVVEAWLESDGHCDNLMAAAVREFGLACIDAGAGGAPGERRYWTLVLGAPPRQR